MSHAPGSEPHKRKRSVEDDGRQLAHHRQRQSSPGLSSSAPESIINFTPRNNSQLLAFLPGDAGTFSDIVYLISEYEGVLDRSESLAANLGAKLTGPRFLRGLERFFEGPININSPNPNAQQVTWLDVVMLAKASPGAFALVSSPGGARCCQFMYQGLQVEITEDDWRLISSGALDQFPLEHTFEEDEVAELATLEILEQRALLLHRRADEVAERARTLRQRLELRRHDISRRQQQQLHDGASSSSYGSSYGSDSSSGSSSSFHAINHPPRPAIPRPGSSQFDIHADLLQQFTMAAMQHNPPSGPPPGYQPRRTSVSSQSPLAQPSLEAPPYQPSSGTCYAASTQPSVAESPLAVAPAPISTSAASPSSTAPDLTPTSNSRSIATTTLRQAALPSDPATEVYRPLVLQKTDMLDKGDVIFPPCDRCRRLRLQCIKHLTACRGCTKKHARCNWRNVTDDEAAALKEDLEKMRREAQKAAAAAAAAARQQSNAGGNARPYEAGPSMPASYGAVNMGPAPSLLMAPPLAPLASLAPLAPLTPAAAPEPPRRLLPTARLTRIEPAPTAPRSPPRTGQLASILSPPDYEPQPFGMMLPDLAPR
ncbi:hypothetical protein MKX07_008124 [Trichoderma sp. CBMAI-0711]|nr:hypothetical protein MKX07_008124 [Trichoderma sp. CBMAI-0711]